MTRSVHLLRAGIQTTVQDAGRPEWTGLGVPIGGALDPEALAIANRNVGNPANAAGLEITLQGPRLRFSAPATLSLVGGEVPVTLNGGEVRQPGQIAVPAGGEVDIGWFRSGCRGWLAVSGGLKVPEVLGSRATCLSAGLGGWEGRALRAGDVLPLGEVSGDPPAKPEIWRLPDLEAPVRLLPGPEIREFPPESLGRLLSQPFTVTPESNRMGLRLRGPALRRCAGFPEMLTGPVLPGTLQVPAEGQPILLLADAQTTGGYPRLAVVAASELPRLAQLRPGSVLRFCDGSSLSGVQPMDLTSRP